MEEILYVKIEQNIPVKKRALTYKDIASLYCTNKKIVQKLEQETFYTLPANGNQKTMFTINKVYEGIHKIYPNLRIENVGEKDFIVDLELPDGREKSKTREYVKTAFVALIVFFGAAFTIMTFNEDVNVSNVFDKVYKLIMGTSKQGGSILEISYGGKIKDDPTPIQVEMCTYEEQVNKAMIKTASREGHTIDSN